MLLYGRLTEGRVPGSLTMIHPASCIPFLRFEMVPVVHVLVQELGLCMVHTIETQSVKVFLDLCDCTFDDRGPVSITIGAVSARVRQTEVFFEGLKVLAYGVDGFATLLIDGISLGNFKCLEVLKDSLLLAATPSIHHVIHRVPKPSS
jgi:hypothetical protein